MTLDEFLDNFMSNSTKMARSRRGGKRACNLLLHYSRTLILISFYYACSIGLTFYQKNLFRNFKFPLMVVVCHLIIKFIFAGICREVYTLSKRSPRVTLPLKVYIKRLFPPGFAAGLDIGLSQWSLEYITVTLYTMSKSTALLFILFFAIVFKLEEMRWSVVILIALIVGGLFMFTYHYTEFNLLGFLLVLSAAILSGLRWTLSEIVMRKGELGLTNPIDMVYHIQPWMMLSLLPLAIVMEGDLITSSEKGFRFHSLSSASEIWLEILIGAILAFFMELSEFLVVCYTSSLTLSIAGVAKEILTLSLAVHYSHENLSIVNQLGLVLCVVGISIHVLIKAYQMPSTTTNSSHQQRSNSVSSSEGNSVSTIPLMSSNDSDE